MNMRSFLNLDHPEKYDFTECTAGDAYKQLNSPERFFAYHSSKVKGSTRFEIGSAKYAELKERGVLDGLVDPDSNCRLLRDIYALLWEEKYLDFRGLFICGETMNSANTTLNEFISSNKREHEKLNEFKNSTKSRQNMSINYLINRFYDSDNELKSFLDETESLKKFLSIYHTLGNFIPFPVGCNPTRGCGTTCDYWDLTLKHIYEYYKIKDSDKTEDAAVIIQKICKNTSKIPDAETNLKKWLDKFGSWESFIDENYMSPFVDENGEPKELWEGHFDGAVLPDFDQCNEYFKNASEWILARGKLMVEVLREKISGMEKTI